MKQILLDLDNVLLDTFDYREDGSPRFFWAENIQKDLGFDPRTLQHIFTPEFLLQDLNATKEVAMKIISQGTRKLTFEDFESYWKEHDANMNLEVWQWVIEISKTYKIHIASNQPVIRMNFLLEKFPQWRDVFSEIFYPHPMQAFKPQKKFFEIALQKLGVKPSEVIFIDDEYKNTKTASDLGIKSIHFKSIADLQKIAI